MWPNPQFPANLVTLTEEILNGKLDFLCSETAGQCVKSVQSYSYNRDISAVSIMLLWYLYF